MSATIDFEKESYSEVRDVVTTIVHNRMNAGTPMDVETHTSCASTRSSHMEKAESTKTTQTKITAASSTATEMKKADPYASWERTRKGDGRPKASRRRKRDTSTEHAANSGRRVTEAEAAGVKGAKADGNGEQNGQGDDTPRVGMDTKVDTTTTTAATREEASS